MLPLNCRTFLLLALAVACAALPADAADAPAAAPPGASMTAGAGPGTVTLNLKDVPLQELLDMVAAGVGKRYIVKGDVKELEVSAHLPDVLLEDALAALLEAHDLVATEMGSGIVLVSAAPTEVEPDETEDQPPPIEVGIVKLKHADAYDVRDALFPLLTPYGQIDVVKQSGFTGWGFGSAGSDDRSGGGGGGGGGGRGSSGGDRFGRPFEARERTRRGLKREVRSQLLVLKDTVENMAVLRELIAVIDVRPKQVLITASIVEIDRNELLDLGVDFFLDIGGEVSLEIDSATLRTTPANFDSVADVSSVLPFDAGGTAVFRVSNDFRAVVHALEEHANANVLSAPRLLTLDNQEASILIGTRFPILESDTTGTDVAQVTTSLDYYENIGIQLNVVPQIQDGRYINMIVHPVVSRQDGSVISRGAEGQVVAEYPIIDTRESESQIMIEDGQFIAIGGLLKEIAIESETGIPILMHIPLFGRLFRRTTTGTKKVDLIVFLSAAIIDDPAEASEEKMTSMRARGEIGTWHRATPAPESPEAEAPDEQDAPDEPAGEAAPEEAAEEEATQEQPEEPVEG